MYVVGAQELEQSGEADKIIKGLKSIKTQAPLRKRVTKSCSRTYPLAVWHARKRTRTFTGLLPRDFKSLVSTIPPSEQKNANESEKLTSFDF